MAAAVPFLPFIAAGTAATASLMTTAQQRAISKSQESRLKMEADVARQQAGLESEAIGRETRRQFGETRAVGAQGGLLDSVTFGDVYKQSATAAQLDQMMVEYQGETQAQALLNEARFVKAARPSWALGVLQAASAGLGAYAGSGGSLERTPKLEEVKVTGRRIKVPSAMRMTTSDVTRAARSPRSYGSGLIAR